MTSPSTPAPPGQPAECVNCGSPVIECPDHAPITYGQCGGWQHTDGRLHLCNPGGHPPRIADGRGAADGGEQR